MGRFQITMAIYGGGSQGRLVLLLGCALVCLAASEVVTLDEQHADALEMQKKRKKGKAKGKAADKAAPAPAPTESSLRHGNTLQTPEERYKDAQKGSLAGPADPGYGPASASRTDMQRGHEKDVEDRKQIAIKAQLKNAPIPVDDPLEPATRKEAKMLQRAMFRRINRVASGPSATPREISRSQASVIQIRRKARAIRAKIEAAKQELKDQMKATKDSAEDEEESPTAEGNLSKEEQEKQAIQAEEDKLRAEDEKAGNKAAHDSGSLFAKDEPIAVHKSGNWADKTRTPALKHWRPRKNRHDPASWREKGDTPESQKKP